MNDIVIPFLISAVSIIGIAINPKNNIVLRILVISASILFLIVRFSRGEINELLLLIFLAISMFIGNYYYLLVDNERS